ncbi:MAG: PAS domain-containing protein [Acidimicrobiales bacterium]
MPGGGAEDHSHPERRVQPAAPGPATRDERLFESAPDGLIESDLGGRIVRANAQAGALLRLPAGEMVGQLVSSYVTGPKQPGFTRTVEALGSARLVRRIEVDMASRRRPPFLASLAVVVVELDDGEPRLVWSVRDMSDRHRAERVRGRDGHDELTDVLRRAQYFRSLQGLLHRQRPGDGTVAVMTIGVDRFR